MLSDRMFPPLTDAASVLISSLMMSEIRFPKYNFCQGNCKKDMGERARGEDEEAEQEARGDFRILDSSVRTVAFFAFNSTPASPIT